MQAIILYCSPTTIPTWATRKRYWELIFLKPFAPKGIAGERTHAAMIATKQNSLTVMLLFIAITFAMVGCDQDQPDEQAGGESGADSHGTDDDSNSTAQSKTQEAGTSNDADDVTMSNAQGKTMTLSMRTLPNSRGFLYCELVFNYGDKGNDIYSTSPIGEPQLDWWDTLDLDALAMAYGAESVYKNGPQWWSMDEVGVMASEAEEVAGVEMVFGAHLPPGTLAIPKYTVFNPAKFQNLVWKAGKPVYQIVHADGHVYVLQGHKIPAEELAALGDRFQNMPEGWEYRVKVLDDDLVMHLTPSEPIPSIQDEFDQIYIRIPESE